MRTLVVVLALISATLPLAAQPASFVYRLGKDTVAIDQFTRTATRLSGEMVQRTGAAVTRLQYDMTIGADGRPTGATIRRLQGDGSPPPNTFSETRFRVTADSIVREVVWPDSVQRRAVAANKAWIAWPTFVYGPTELLAAARKAGGNVDSVPALGAAGGLTYTGLSTTDGDHLRQGGGAYAMQLRFDNSNRLQSVDGAFTTNKSIAARGKGGLDIAATARGMKPTGTLSARDVARGAFGPGGIVLVDYGRPQVRERTVWGGALVPFDSVWRTGANDATHLFTTRILTFGALTVPPGTYTLWVQHTRTGTSLIINKQIGQWGTVYDPAQDLGRVSMQLTPAPAPVEEFTVAVRALGGNRGALEFAWGPSVATAPFSTSIPRP